MNFPNSRNKVFDRNVAGIWTPVNMKDVTFALDVIPFFVTMANGHFGWVENECYQSFHGCQWAEDRRRSACLENL